MGRLALLHEGMDDKIIPPVELMLAERACERIVVDFIHRLDLGDPGSVAELFTRTASGTGPTGIGASRGARPWAASLPGSVEEVWYDTGGGDRWFRHVGDAEFLAAWLEHPEFRLVK